MSGESYSNEQRSPIQSHANDGGVRVNSEFIKAGTSSPHPKKTDQGDLDSTLYPATRSEYLDQPSLGVGEISQATLTKTRDQLSGVTESTPQSDTQASAVAPQSVVSKQYADGLPPHVWPLLASLERYPRDHRERLLDRLVQLICGPWRERLELWVKTHPIKHKITPSHVPPIAERGGDFYWVTRRERRRR